MQSSQVDVFFRRVGSMVRARSGLTYKSHGFLVYSAGPCEGEVPSRCVR